MEPKRFDAFRQLKLADMYNLNLDCENLRSYPPSQKLFHQLKRYPQEIIPLMDHTLTEVFLDMFEDAELPDGTTWRVSVELVQRWQ